MSRKKNENTKITAIHPTTKGLSGEGFHKPSSHYRTGVQNRRAALMKNENSSVDVLLRGDYAIFPYVLFRYLPDYEHLSVVKYSKVRMLFSGNLTNDETENKPEKDCLKLLENLMSSFPSIKFNVIDKVDMEKYKEAAKLYLALEEIKR